MQREPVDALLQRIPALEKVGNALSVRDWARGFAQQAAHDDSTRQRFRWLARATAHDVVLGKLLESHLDALQILHELLGATDSARLLQHLAPADGLWGVWCAQAAGVPALRLEHGDAGPRITGRKSWCSGAGLVQAALLTCDDAGQSQLVAVAMNHPGVQVTQDGWHAVGMAGTGSVDVVFDQVPAIPVGLPGAYVDRAGFWHGAAGVAACWHGGACAIAQPLRQRVREAGAQADGLLAAPLGVVDCALEASALVLRDAADRIDSARAGGEPFGRRHALRARGVVEAAAQTVLAEVGRALGAGPLCRDAAHARRTADLAVFLRQSHAQWDLAVQGRLLAADDGADGQWQI